jgi:hypothetical protein
VSTLSARPVIVPGMTPLEQKTVQAATVALLVCERAQADLESRIELLVPVDRPVPEEGEPYVPSDWYALVHHRYPPPEGVESPTQVLLTRVERDILYHYNSALRAAGHPDVIRGRRTIDDVASLV